jgi:hypothetical protein
MTAPIIKPGSIFAGLTGATAAPVTDRDGKMTFFASKAFQDADTRITNSLNQFGQLLNTAQVAGLPADIATMLQHLTATGELDSLTSVAANVNTDHIADGTGFPLAGGKAAYLALVTSGPGAGQVLAWNGAAWVPTTLAANVSSLDGISGAVLLHAGSGITITDNSPVAGDITIAASAVSGSYVKGAVITGPIAGAGTFTASGTVTGAAVGSVVSVGVVNGTEAALLSNLLGWVSSANNVTIQYTASGASLSLNLPVVVFN